MAPRLVLCAALIAAAGAFVGDFAVAQNIGILVPPPDKPISASDKEDANRPFRLVAQSTDNTEALQDFDRHRQRGTWERAFKALEKAKNANPNALVPRDDDFYIPSRIYLRQVLATMPQAGKDAYRLFQDPEARKLFDQAQGKNEISQLKRIVEDYFLASVADAAADRLGDLEFERGDVEQAADRWQSILRYRPESDLPQAQLMVKSAVALMRAGRWDESRGIVRQLRERHPDAVVRLGGREVKALEHLNALLDSRPTEQKDPGQRVYPDLNFATDVPPSWQFEILSATSAKELAAGGNNPWMWNGYNLPADTVPPAAVDASRVYINFVGFYIAIDLKTGKLLWRSAKFHDIVQKMRQNNSRVMPEQYGLCLGGERVFFVARHPGQDDNNNRHFIISCRDTATGKEHWTSQNVEDLKKWHMWGAPIASHDRVYISAFPADKNRDLHMLAIQASDGKLLWSTHCGTYQVDESQLYNQRSSQPSLVLDGERLYLDTHIGSLILFDTRNGATLWGFNYDAETPGESFWYYQPRKLLSSGAPVLAGEVLYVKGMRSPRLCGIQLAGPSVLFKRPVSMSAILMGADEERLYLGGEEISAIDLKTQKLLWVTKVPIATDYTRPILTHSRLYQFTPRGIFEIDKATGDVVKRYRGADLDSLGGALLLAKRTLVSVSNLSLTAYALPDEPAAAPPQGVAGP